MRRRLMLSTLLTAFVVGSAVAWVALRPGSAICRGNYDRLEVGMSRAEVQEILGGNARDESTGQLYEELFGVPLLFCPGKSQWVSDSAVISLQFYRNELTSKKLVLVYREPEGIWATVSRWLRPMR